MGKEYILSVPHECRQAVALALEQHLESLLQCLDPKTNDAFLNVYASAVAEGLYVCDNLSNSSVAASVIRRAIDLMLLHAPSVSISEA